MTATLSELLCRCESEVNANMLAASLALAMSIGQQVATPAAIRRPEGWMPRGLPKVRIRVTDESGELCVVREWI